MIPMFNQNSFACVGVDFHEHLRVLIFHQFFNKVEFKSDSINDTNFRVVNVDALLFWSLEIETFGNFHSNAHALFCKVFRNVGNKNASMLF